MENTEITEEVKQPAIGPSMAFGIGFWIFYLVIVFIVLGVFFRIPF